MKTCDLCKKQYISRNKKFCSKICLLKSNGKKSGGKNKNRIQLFCIRCKSEYEVTKSRVEKSKYCSIECHNRSNSENIDRKADKNPRWKGGIQTYRSKAWKHFDKKCSICKCEENLEIHHINGNRYDNRIENLQPVCRKCHQSLDGRSKRGNGNKFISHDVSCQP
jgi:hypothetical protein